MDRLRARRFWLPLVAAFFWLSTPASAVDIDWVTVGDPGNAADDTGYGAVAYAYRIGKYEVTNAQYAELLNAVAATDTHGLYSTSMGSGYGGITRSGSSGSYTYSTIAGREDMPVNYVSFYDALRFANWLHNGQPTGAQVVWTTEDGAYDMSLGSSVVRKAGAQAFLTSEDEWYKAAYYAGSDSYYDYPAGSDTMTTCAAPGATANTANCYWAAGGLTDAGSYTGSPSPNATFDQGGNVWEWNEAIISVSNRGKRGGGFINNRDYLAASYRSPSNAPTYEAENIGFRVARPPVIDWVTVGDPGNAADDTGYGAVAYAYQIGKYEVTNAQYAELLNAVAATDTYSLYSTSMGWGYGGITRSGSSGSYTYSTIAGREDMPVNYVSFYDALRFANWLHNGQPTGAQDGSTTEDGAYDMSLGSSVVRKAGAQAFLTSEDEWYKAAYYAGSDSYYNYPAGSDTQTTCALPGATANRANCGDVVGDLTDVGSYTGSASPNGSFEQGGNVWEWNEALIGSGRGLRGGGFYYCFPCDLAASCRIDLDPTYVSYYVGFRVARPGSAAPVPSLSPVGVVLLGGFLLGIVGLVRRHT